MRAILATILVSLLTITFTLPGEALTPNSGYYSGAGTIVLGATGSGETDQLILVDNGAVTCTSTNFATGASAGIGGVCIPFNDLGGDAVYVKDNSHGTDMAFQVCVDMDGDNICTGNSESGQFSGCQDHIVFSHNSFSGDFINPLYIPPIFRSDYYMCGSAGFEGYIVIICAGLDSVPAPHQHEASNGDVFGVTAGPTGFGTFCGGPTAAKAYAVV